MCGLPSGSPSPSTSDKANWWDSSRYFFFSSGSAIVFSRRCFFGLSKERPETVEKSRFNVVVNYCI